MMLDERKLEVLRAIVTDYVSYREPVGSKALVERHNLSVSPATIRNEMSVLEDEGYLIQPHTSAGRIPTDKGYRLYVDRLAEIKPLSGAERRAIAAFMRGAVDLDDVVHRTVRLLAQLTNQVAIVQYPTSPVPIRHVELVSLSVDRVLVVVIRGTGAVVQRTVELSGHTETHLSELRDWVNRLVINQPVNAGVDALTGALDQLSDADRRVVTPLVMTLVDVLASNPSERVVVGGVPNLTRFGEEYETTIKPMLEALEEQVVLLRLLGEASADNNQDVTVRIGGENDYEPLHTTSVVASRYGIADELSASMGVVGPTRMDYPSTMSVVRAVATYVRHFLTEG